MTEKPTDKPADLNALVKSLAREAGFSRAAVTSAEPLGREDFLRDWLSAGHAGRMEYLHRNSEKRNDPGQLLDGARSVICLAADYCDGGPDDLAPAPPSAGYVARYARGRDYHRVLRKRGHALVARLRERVGGEFGARVCVDSAPLLERELAARAGLGWIGKNTMLIDPATGSYFFLAEVITTLAIAPDAGIGDHCGRCRRCLDGCPTGAFPEPGVMDASRCISYLTIELRDGSLPEPAGRIGAHLFGCDICQAVCPFNERFAEAVDDEQLVPRQVAAGRVWFELAEVADWTREDYQRRLSGSAGKRATLEMWKRNARASMGHAGGD